MGKPTTLKKRRRAARQHYIKHNHPLYTCYVKNCIKCAENFILNLSGYVLSRMEKILLSMGLTFIPTPQQPTPFEVLRDFNNFSRKLRSMTKPVPARHNQHDLTYLELTNQNPQKQSHIQTTLTLKGHLTT